MSSSQLPSNDSAAEILKKLTSAKKENLLTEKKAEKHPDPEDKNAWIQWINDKAVKQALKQNAPATANSPRWMFATNAICYMAELTDHGWPEKTVKPQFPLNIIITPKLKPHYKDYLDKLSAVPADLQRTYDCIIGCIDEAIRTVLSMEDTVEAQLYMEDICIFLKALTNGRRPQRFCSKVILGAVLLTAIHDNEGEDFFPSRSSLYDLMEKQGIPLSKASMAEGLAYYLISDYVRDNSIG